MNKVFPNPNKKPNNIHLRKFVKIEDDDGKKVSRAVDELVLLSFKGKDPDPKKKFVRHINNDYRDSRLENLEWVEMIYEPKEDEKFVDIKKFEGLYKISTEGNVLDCTTGDLTNFMKQNGYFVVILQNGNTYTKFYVHELVAYHFLKPQKGGCNKYNKHIDKYSISLDDTDTCAECDAKK